MSNTTKRQGYTYSLVTAAWSDTITDDAFLATPVCSDKASFFLRPPRDAITIENLWTHLVLQFDDAIDPAYRKIEEIGIASTGQASGGRSFSINRSADAVGKIDLRMDLSALLNRDNVAYFDFAEEPVDGGTYVYIKMPDEIAETNTAWMLLWKVDALFTTQGIR